MKGKNLTSALGKALQLCSLVCAGTVAWQSQAEQLSSGNSVATINPTSGGGLTGWMVENQNQLSQQSFLYRFGDATPGNANQLLTTLSSTPTVTQTAPNTLTLKYTGSQLQVTLNYWLVGDAPGDGSATLNETIQIRNVSSSTLTGVHFFQFSNFDLAGNPLGDSVQMNLDQGTGLFSGATQSKGGLNLVTSITAQSDAIPFAGRGEAGLGTSTYNALQGAYDLNNTLSAGPGDATWALEWNFNLNPNQNYTITKSELISGVLVPEPSAVALLAVGLVGVITAARRRGQRID